MHKVYALKRTRGAAMRKSTGCCSRAQGNKEKPDLKLDVRFTHEDDETKNKVKVNKRGYGVTVQEHVARGKQGGKKINCHGSYTYYCRL